MTISHITAKLGIFISSSGRILGLSQLSLAACHIGNRASPQATKQTCDLDRLNLSFGALWNKYGILQLLKKACSTRGGNNTTQIFSVFFKYYAHCHCKPKSQYFQLQTTLTVDPWANYLIISEPISFVANRNTRRIYFLSFHIETSKQGT